MSKEKEKQQELREMNFYGEEVGELIRGDIKLLTLRKPNPKYDFEVGEIIVANCSDSGERIRLVVLDNIKKPLGEYTRPELQLDGYESVSAAADDLKQYPGYGEVDRNTVMQGVLTLTEEQFMSLSEDWARNVLLEFGMDAALDVDQPFKDVFWRAWCRWVIARGGGVQEWRYFLLDNDLVYWDETSEEFDGLGSDEMLEIWKDKGSFLYRQVVLMEAGQER